MNHKPNLHLSITTAKKIKIFAYFHALKIAQSILRHKYQIPESFPWEKFFTLQPPEKAIQSFSFEEIIYEAERIAENTAFVFSLESKRKPKNVGH